MFKFFHIWGTGETFNEFFFTSTPNQLTDLLPEYGHLSNVIRVIDIQAAAGGKTLQILMNAEKEQAVAILMGASQE